MTQPREVYKEPFFDLQKKLTTDPVFASKASTLLNKISEADSRHDKKSRDESIMQLLRLCDNNPSLLVPIFFPKFSVNKPMSLLSRPHAIAMMAIAPNASVTICSSRQIGKCLSGTSILRVEDAEGTRQDTTIKELFDSF